MLFKRSLKSGYWQLLLICMTMIGCRSSQPLTEMISGAVTKVHDGDSIHITPSREKRVVIRLAGIDAPELAQPFGIDSRDKLRSLILKRQVNASCSKTDRYQRKVCVVYYQNADINLEMIKSGMAWHYKQYQNEQSMRQRKQYANAEIAARNSERGLWSEAGMEPWLFRKMN